MSHPPRDGAGSAVVGILVDGSPRLCDPRQPVLSAFDLGLVRGDGIFETMLVRDGAIHRLSAHLDRMCRSAAGMDLPTPDRGALAALAAACADGWSPAVEGALRLTMTRGQEHADTGPTCLATLSPVEEVTLAQRRTGVSVRLLGLGVSSEEAARSPWLLRGVKSLSYAVNMAARRAAAATGADDAVFVSSDGQVLEGPTSTVVWAGGGVLHTPPVELGILPGTSQLALYEQAVHRDWRVEYTATTPGDLHAAEAVWLLSSIRGAAAVTSIDGIERGDAGRTPAIQAMLEL